MAHKKATGSTRLGRDSQAQRLGVKIYGEQHAKAGNIIIRQHGLSYNPGDGVGVGSDNTLFALRDGLVRFNKVMKRKFTGALKLTRIVSIVDPSEKRGLKAKAHKSEAVVSEKAEVKQGVKAEVKEEAKAVKTEVKTAAVTLDKKESTSAKKATVKGEVKAAGTKEKQAAKKN